MAEGDPGRHGEQPVGLGRLGGVGAEAKTPGRPPQQRRVAGRFGRGQQQQEPGRLRERGDPPPVTLFDPVGQRPSAGQPESAGQLRRGHPAGQLEQGQRVTAGLGDDPVPDPLIEPPRQHRGQQRPGVRIGEPRDH